MHFQKIYNPSDNKNQYLLGVSFCVIVVNMFEESKGYEQNKLYYMSAHCNGETGKVMVKTTCEKLPQLQTAKPVSISYNKQRALSRKKSRSENKLSSGSPAALYLFHPDKKICNGSINRLSGTYMET